MLTQIMPKMNPKNEERGVLTRFEFEWFAVYEMIEDLVSDVGEYDSYAVDDRKCSTQVYLCEEEIQKDRAADVQEKRKRESPIC